MLLLLSLLLLVLLLMLPSSSVGKPQCFAVRSACHCTTACAFTLQKALHTALEAALCASLLTECLYPRNLNLPCRVGSSVSAMKRVLTRSSLI